jgi:hypothetical protein
MIIMSVIKYRENITSPWKEIVTIKGNDGKDGYTPQKGVDYFDGKDGVDGKDGTDGIGITSIEQTAVSTESDGNNVVTVTLTNGSQFNFTVKNGSAGASGRDGSTPYINNNTWWIGDVDTGINANGVDGENGLDGESITITSVSESIDDDGYNTITFSDGTTVKVKNGSKGSDGKVPTKGVDYYTPEEREEYIQEIKNAISGDIDILLSQQESILAMQNELIGGDTV